MNRTDILLSSALLLAAACGDGGEAGSDGAAGDVPDAMGGGVPDATPDGLEPDAADVSPEPVDPAFENAPPASETLMAGTGERELGFPVGTAKVGLSPKPGVVTPWAEAYPGTDSRHTELTAKAVVLRRNGKIVALVRTDSIGIWQAMIEDARSKLRELGRGDLAEGLVVGATHSHASGGRVFDHFIGEIAVGEFLPGFYRRVRDAIVGSVLDADAAAVPARVGHGAIQVPSLHSDRRCENGPVQDDTMGLVKVESEGGDLLAVVVNYAAHGTVLGHGDWVLSSDAPGAVETGIEAALPDEANVIYFQSWAGDMAPDRPEGLETAAGFDLRDGYVKLAAMARAAGEAVVPALDDIETVADPELGVLTTHFPIDADLINPDGSFSKFPGGGIYCVPSSDNCGPEQKVYTAKDLKCFGIPEDLTIQWALMSALRIGDLALVTLPGEPLTSVGVELRARVKTATGLGEAFVLGYSQGYLGYLLHPDDYYLAGYEANGSLMGPHFGEYLIETGVSLATRLTNPGAPLSFEPVEVPFGPSLQFDDLPHETALGDAAITSEPAIAAGVVAATWTGGDPAVDFPVVTLERETAAGSGTFEPVRHPSGQVLDSRGPEIELQLVPEPTWDEEISLDARTWHWTARLPTVFTVEPAGGQLQGTFRFRIEGTRPEPYSLTSAPFTI